jgi:hypothetical protein
MTRVVRSRRAGLSRDQVSQQPLYARMLGLQYLAPSGFLCFVFLEGAFALGILLALAELVSWWGVIVLPVMVAVMVKLNDVVAGMLARPAPAAVAPVRRAPVRPATPRSVSARSSTPGAAMFRADLPYSTGSPPDSTYSSASWADSPHSDASREDSPYSGASGAESPNSEDGARTVDLRGRLVAPMPAPADVDASALNGPPASRQWADQWVRQSATRRYE